MNDIYVGGYWGAREESVDACAHRLSMFLETLSGSDPVFATWYERGRSRRDASRCDVDSRNRDHLIRLLERGRNRRDDNLAVIEDLGFQIGLWNGQKGNRSAGLSVICGSHASNPNLGNCAVVDLPEDLGELRRSERMAKILATVARSWHPDWAGVISQDSGNSRDYIPGIPFVDWMLYLSDKTCPVRAVPEPSFSQRVDDLGAIIVVQAEPVQPGNPVHLNHVRAVERAVGIRAQE